MHSAPQSLAATIAARSACRPSRSAQAGDNQIEEVVVTAQKRAQNFSDVGIAVTRLQRR